jgi:hypothetical protein
MRTTRPRAGSRPDLNQREAVVDVCLLRPILDHDAPLEDPGQRTGIAESGVQPVERIEQVRLIAACSTACM